MKFEPEFFVKLKLSQNQIEKNLNNAVKDLGIAKKVDILDVRFSYAYSALIKAGIALLSYHQVKIKSVVGHQAKIIEKLAEILRDDSIRVMGNAMRTKRNLDFYAGGIEVTEKECREYLSFVAFILKRTQDIMQKTKRSPF
jgi:hypothetical protein